MFSSHTQKSALVHWKCILSNKIYFLQSFHLDIKYILEEIAQPLQQFIVTGKNITAM